MFTLNVDHVRNLDMDQNTYVFYFYYVTSYFTYQILQGHRKHDEPVEQSVPNMIPSNKNEELLHWNENDMRQSLRKSRLGRGKEAIFI